MNDNVKHLSALRYNTPMSESKPEIFLYVKQWGQDLAYQFDSVETAIESAIRMIAEGKAIPTMVCVNGAVVYKQADINTYWAEVYCEG